MHACMHAYILTYESWLGRTLTQRLVEHTLLALEAGFGLALIAVRRRRRSSPWNTNSGPHSQTDRQTDNQLGIASSGTVYIR